MYNVILFSDSVGRDWASKPLGSYRIATELRKHGYTVKVIDYFSRWLAEPEALNKLLEKIVSKETLFIGFSGVFYGKRDFEDSPKSYQDYKARRFNLSVWPSDTEFVNRLFTGVKQKYPWIKLVYGGIYNARKDQALTDVMDFMVHGIADKKVIEIADHLAHNTALRRNVLNRKIIDHDVKGLEFDFPSSEVIFTEDDDVVRGEVLPMETSRGCLFKCSFCEYPLIGRKKSDPEYIKHPETLERELINNYERFGVTKYMFVDDTFNETTEKLERLLKIRDRTKIDILFSSYIRVDLLCRFPEQISLLKDLGIQSAFLGIESLNWESAKAIGKGIHPDKIKETLYSMAKAWGNGTSMHGSFIVGLPHDNKDSLDQWIPWVINESPLDGFDFNPLGIASNGYSELSKNSEKFGYRFLPNKEFPGGPKYRLSENWVNQYWSKIDADRYSIAVMNDAWSSGRLKVSGWDIMGLQNMGYRFDELKSLPLKDVDRHQCDLLLDQSWFKYRSKMLE